MPIVAEEEQFLISVETHAASHSFAVIAAAGRQAGSPGAVLVVVEGADSADCAPRSDGFRNALRIVVISRRRRYGVACRKAGISPPCIPTERLLP